MTASILIVEDEEPIKVLLTYNFEAEGYRVRATASGEDVGPMIADERPRSHHSRLDAAGHFRDRGVPPAARQPETRDIPIIMLTARGEETERVRGFATGADDYIVKPFSVPGTYGPDAKASCAASIPMPSPRC